MLDLTEPAQIKTAVADAFAHFGRIDVAVSNATYGSFGAGEEVSNAQIDLQIATNLTGSIHVIRALLPRMRARGGRRIIQVSSEGGPIAYPNFSLYHATKWGIEGFIQSVSQEVAPFGIDFLIAEPGPTTTQFGAGLDHAVSMDSYENTAAGEVRHAIRDDAFAHFSRAEQVVETLIDMADKEEVPLRLALGGTAYSSISKGLTERLQSLEADKAISLAVDNV
ncbi:SDR family oxidoreductase [Robbsia andropogonis]|uniref:SDR family oxidoreductase n=2 Tax=Robbsia andropogonis TaxID=28092 RepID=UPI0004ACA959|nr:SDR family oxidoreductase [Robbsia andropogonis]MCP1121475.1 SDR family oxidoreductase [Robbsia andropogonis]MCP1131297.1 SDR family oxidoreductase [Robbsia andropogonis]